ncbi:hypothetical protein C100_18155 [Sphingobium sp. C100]|nr:hypothetical protein C100_18155 [Sphingobium sp. C100]
MQRQDAEVRRGLSVMMEKEARDDSFMVISIPIVPAATTCDGNDDLGRR